MVSLLALLPVLLTLVRAFFVRFSSHGRNF